MNRNKWFYFLCICILAQSFAGKTDTGAPEAAASAHTRADYALPFVEFGFPIPQRLLIAEDTLYFVTHLQRQPNGSFSTLPNAERFTAELDSRQLNSIITANIDKNYLWIVPESSTDTPDFIWTIYSCEKFVFVMKLMPSDGAEGNGNGLARSFYLIDDCLKQMKDVSRLPGKPIIFVTEILRQLFTTEVSYYVEGIFNHRRSLEPNTLDGLFAATQK